jgi:hypothetical protein
MLNKAASQAATGSGLELKGTKQGMMLKSEAISGLAAPSASHLMASQSARNLGSTQSAIVQGDGGIHAMPVDRAVWALALAEGRPKYSSAIKVAQQIVEAADNAATTPVSTSSLSVNLKYLLVNLSRSPWWSDVLLTLDNWYVPGQKRATFIAETKPPSVIGVPVALVLTADVQITANWSQVDREAAESHSHIGPWGRTTRASARCKAVAQPP